ncbi:MAG: lysophospholipid acyltransferase family protein [Arcobacteraceae bacterium]|nr:lysophospholipid acyltransferase family protein [Arcobacteraceae bacterium]
MRTQQRGSGWSIKLAFNLYKILGYKFIYYLMYPVTFFYFIFASNVKDALKIYYKHLNIKFTNKIYYEHLRLFAICMIDRFISKIDIQNYTFKFDDEDTPTAILNDGAILLFSHFGGWAASVNSANVKNKINVVMKETMMGEIKEIENSIETKSNTHIIDLSSGTLSVSIQIANALLKNEVVAIMGDRSANKKAEIEIEFLGEMARFNKNPFQIAYKTHKPILVYFIILISMQEYKIEWIKIDMDTTLTEQEAVLKGLQTYIKKYEEIIKIYPNQWLNFYDFWEK